MTPTLLILVALATLLAPPFAIFMAGLLVHHGLWSLEWAVPVLYGLVCIRHLAWGQKQRPRPITHLLVLFPYTLGALLAGLYIAHFWHEMLPAPLRWLLTALLFSAVLAWLSRADRYLPSKYKRLVRKLPSPRKLPRGSRRAGAAIIAMAFWPPEPVELDQALDFAFAEQDLKLGTSPGQWTDKDPKGLRAIFGARRVLLLASEEGQPSDVFLARVMFDHEGRPTRVTGVFNLTQTGAASEQNLHLERQWAAWTLEAGGKLRSLELADLRSEPSPNGPGWNWFGRRQRWLTNIQETGQFRGVGRSSIALPDAQETFDFSIDEQVLTFPYEQSQVQLELGRAPGESFLRSNLELKAQSPPRPGSTTTWAVDRVRGVSWIGSDGMQWIKGVAFAASARLEDLHADVVGVDAEQQIAEELGDVLEQLPITGESSLSGWPPAPLETAIQPVMPAEGKWVDLGRDAIGGDHEPGTGPVVFTFIRVDPKRSYNQVSITLWDPRRLELHITAGTEEPKSTIGQQGTGLIPREPKTIERLVGAFNGAFQAVHGEYGMVEEGRVQLPPKPFAATVVTGDDGVARFGTWPGEPTNLPPGTVGLRQNMTPLVVDGKANPYARTWWGGVPEGWAEEARTVRSGLCLTQENFIAYFYSPSIDPDRLASAMLRARCTYGIHLDMNAGHAGFEFYRVNQAAELPNLGRPLDPAWEASGKVSGLDGYSFLSRLMVRKMPLMNFPRYIHETPRDFFYLTRRVLLPGAPLVLPAPLSASGWSTVASENNDFPPFVVTTTATLSAGPDAKVRFTRLDPKQLDVKGNDSARAVSFCPGADCPLVKAQPGAPALTFDQGKFTIGNKPQKGSLLLVAGGGAEDRPLYCIDADGFLTVAEGLKRASADERRVILEALACQAQLYAQEPVQLTLGTKAAAPSAPTLFRKSGAGAGRIFPETPFSKPTVWAIPQARRVNYEPN